MDYKDLLIRNVLTVAMMGVLSFAFDGFGIIHWSIALGITNGMWLIHELGI